MAPHLVVGGSEGSCRDLQREGGGEGGRWPCKGPSPVGRVVVSSAFPQASPLAGLQAFFITSLAGRPLTFFCLSRSSLKGKIKNVLHLIAVLHMSFNCMALRESQQASI